MWGSGKGNAGIRLGCLKGFSRLEGSVILLNRQQAWKESCVSTCLPLVSHAMLSKFFTSGWLLGILDHGEQKPWMTWGMPCGGVFALIVGDGDCRPRCGLTEW